MQEHGGQGGRSAAGTGLLRGCEGLELPSALLFFPPQVDEIYHDESLGVHINIVLVRMIMVGYRQVRTVPVLTSVRSRDEREPFSGWFLEPEALGGHLC